MKTKRTITTKQTPQSEKFAFDWFFKSRTAAELQKRGDTLIKLLERERDAASGGGGGRVRACVGVWVVGCVNRVC